MRTGIKNRLAVMFLCLLLLPALRAATDADSLVIAGNRYYMQKDYEKAAACYIKVVNMGYGAADLYFNLGNAWFKLNNFPKAILYYEKARLLNPADDDIRQNLMIANTRIVDKIDAIPDFFLKRWLNQLTGFFIPDQWAVISLCLFALSLAAFFVYMTGRKYLVRKSGFIAGVITLAFSVSGILLMQNRKGIINNSHGAIVMSPSVTVKSSPDLQGTSVFVLHEGTKVTVTDSLQQWKEVRIPDGNIGWLQSSDLADI